MLAALCWAISPIFIRQGLQGLPSSIWGTAVGMLVATVIYLVWNVCLKQWKEVSGTTRKDYYWQMLGGLTGALGILFRNIALETTRVAIVIALAQTASLFTLIFVPFILGKSLSTVFHKDVPG